MIAYISGHLKITKEEFAEHYFQKIKDAVKRGDEFVLCDARGVDSMAQLLLAESFSDPSTAPVRVYHMLDKPRNNVGFKTVGGFNSDEERDKACTYASDYDIAWVRPGREKSGTANNVYRRKEKNKGQRWDIGIWMPETNGKRISV